MFQSIEFIFHFKCTSFDVEKKKKKKTAKIFSRFVNLLCITFSVGIKKKKDCHNVRVVHRSNVITFHLTWPVFMWRAPGAATSPTHVCLIVIIKTCWCQQTNTQFPLLVGDFRHVSPEIYMPHIWGEEIHIWSVRYIFSFIFRWCIIEIYIHTEHLWALTICLEHRTTVKT